MTITTLDGREAGTGRTTPPSMAERITLIIDLFDGPYKRLSLESIARSTGLPRSTAHRILDQLIALQWLDHNKGGYGLGRRATRLVGPANDHTALRAAAAPHLHTMAMKTGAVVHLAVLDGPDVVYLDKVGGASAAAVASRVGGRAPAHCTALGKAMLAWVAPEDVDAALAGTWRRRTERTLPDLGALHYELYGVRRRSGLAFERGESSADIACAAMAVRDESGPIGAVSVVAPVSAPIERVAPLLVQTVRSITAALGGRPAEVLQRASSRAAS